MAEFYRVREAFTFTSHTGVPRVCTVGEILDGSDPDLKGREQFCEKLSDFVKRTHATETASAAPGEVRAVKRLIKKAAPKPQPAPVPVEPAPVAEPESEL